MTQIICLANSWKRGERCIAGINLLTRQWIRPISSLSPEDGRIPKSIRLVERREPALLDVLDIPLDEKSCDFDFACENVTIACGIWRKVKRVQATDILSFYKNYPYILHNSENYVTVTYLQSLPFTERRTLQLVLATSLTVNSKLRKNGNLGWRGTLATITGQQLTDVSITDPVFIHRLELGDRPQNSCLVTVSLSMPCRPLDWEEDDPCWKLIAGVIELSTFDSIWLEMQRLGWNVEQGRDYLQAHYNKRSRHQLTATELSQFLDYLKSLPTT